MTNNRGPRTVINIISFALVVLVTLVINGCIGYQLGSTLSPSLKTIYTPTFINQCGEPQVENEATQAAIREFQRDGTLKVSGQDQADLILNVTLIHYKLDPLQYREDEAKTTREYRLRIGADIVCKHAKTGKLLISKKVFGESTFDPGGDLSSAKRVALPEAARDLAHDIVECIVEAW